MAKHRPKNDSKNQDLIAWIKSEKGRRSLSIALERSRNETVRLGKARSIDPQKLEKVITH